MFRYWDYGLKRLALLFIRGYQCVAIPFKLIMGGTCACCRFEPSCSEYAIAAYRYHGFFLATRLVLFRLLRCNPWCEGGLDPVPENPNVGR